MSRLHRTLGIIMICLFATPSFADGHIAKLQAAANGDHREQKNIDRNSSRHPVETLDFFGIKDDMTVVEMFPSSWEIAIAVMTRSRAS